MLELKPCPFCGSKPILTMDKEYHYKCPNCSTEGYGETKENAEESWNRRCISLADEIWRAEGGR